jgi:CRP-like cAMP-binding protein
VSDFQVFTFKAGEKIFYAGDAADRLFFIKQGVVQLLGADNNLIASISEGESFGEQAFLTGGIRGASARAQDEVSCVVVTTDEANAILAGASPLLVPVFEALLLQQNMHNALRSQRS